MKVYIEQDKQGAPVSVKTKARSKQGPPGTTLHEGTDKDGGGQARAVQWAESHGHEVVSIG